MESVIIALLWIVWWLIWGMLLWLICEIVRRKTKKAYKISLAPKSKTNDLKLEAYNVMDNMIHQLVLKILNMKFKY